MYTVAEALEYSLETRKSARVHGLAGRRGVHRCTYSKALPRGEEHLSIMSFWRKYVRPYRSFCGKSGCDKVSFDIEILSALEIVRVATQGVYPFEKLRL